MTSSHPLPWHIETDWTVEVTAANGAIVKKFQTREEAEAFIHAAEQNELDKIPITYLDGVENHIHGPADLKRLLGEEPTEDDYTHRVDYVDITADESTIYNYKYVCYNRKGKMISKGSMNGGLWMLEKKCTNLHEVDVLPPEYDW